ncbi:hypothetical protein ACFW17_23730 [Streptomyces sp. NPDC058961]|uniref:hypothetical protein n=1 Tax=Streptomyces sp. NPDC058961 TaxID=3346680 RepID=UPI0036C92D7F
MQKPRPPEGGVWKREWIDTARINAVQFSAINMSRIVVAVDSAGGESTVGDETGVVGVGRDFDRQLYILAYRSGPMGANDWGLPACRLALDSRLTPFWWRRTTAETWRGRSSRRPGSS